MENIFVCDVDPTFEREAREIHTRAGINLFYQIADVKTMVGDNIGIVSTTNCDLHFNSTELQSKAKSILGKYPRYDNSLPVGSAIVIPADLEYNRYVIGTPTTDQIKNSNAYYAMLAALAVTSKFNNRCPRDKQIKTLIVPAIGTKTNKQYFECAIQITEAINNYFSNNDLSDELPRDPNIYLRNCMT